ncbi:glycosyltransferase [Paenibacillus sp. FSL K6-2441]|uniref:glycosyltransferase n=1 Tax=Paenibacillus sp. FSL K6-2441 TaxID=2954679 RepID=UPI0030DBFE16
MEEHVPRVSIIIRTHQRPSYLVQALHSLAGQKYKDFEIVIVEDGLPASQPVIAKFDYLNINYIYTGYSVGRSRAANIGLSHSKGKYINFLDDDDILLPTHVDSMVKVLDIYENVDVVHAASIERKVRVASSDPLVITTISEKVKYNRPFDHKRIFFENMFPIQAAMFRRRLFEQYGGIDESLELLEDWDLWIKYSMFCKFKYNDEVTSVFHVPGDKRKLRIRHQQLKQYEIKIINKYYDYIKQKNYKPINKIKKLIERIQHIF